MGLDLVILSSIFIRDITMKFCKRLNFQLLFLIILGMVLVTSGCRVVSTGVALTVGTAAVAGYTVYQGGKKAVTSVQKATEKGTRGVGEIIFTHGKFKTQCTYQLEHIYSAGEKVLHDLRFRKIRGNYDALSGKLSAETVEGKELSLKLRLIEENVTEVEIRIGSKGNLKNSEVIYDRILSELEQKKEPR